MSIEKRIRRGGLAIQLAMLVAVGIGGYEFNQIRFGGPIHHENQLISDLIGDILPPPEYVIEAYLETTKLIEHPETLSQRKARLGELEGQFNDRQQYWTDSDLDPQLKQIMLTESAPYGRAFWQEVDQQLLPAVERHDAAATQAAYARIEDLYRSHRHGIDDLVAASNARQQEIAETTHTRVVAAAAIVLALALAVFAALTLGLRDIRKSALAPLRLIVDALRRLADGDATARVDFGRRNDEMGELARVLTDFRDAFETARVERESQAEMIVTSVGDGLARLSRGDLTARIDRGLAGPFAAIEADFNRAVAELEQTLSEVLATSRQVSAGAQAMQRGTIHFAKRTDRQTGALAQTAAAVRDITQTIDVTAGNAGEAREIVTQTRDEAAHGGEVLERTMAAMGAIEKASSEIVTIISVIDGIAFQTNLLALNAGVEAARAGDAGKGFAVVANEVRALAQRSADAAADIKHRIESTSGLIASGVGLVGETGDALQRISARVADINGIIDTIASGTRGQAVALRHVDVAMREMDQVTRDNARMVADTTVAVGQLASEAEKLRDRVGSFVMDEASDAVAATGSILKAA